MKKFVVPVLVVAGWIVWTKVREERVKRLLWAAVTDSLEIPGTAAPRVPNVG